MPSIELQMGFQIKLNRVDREADEHYETPGDWGILMRTVITSAVAHSTPSYSTRQETVERRSLASMSRARSSSGSSMRAGFR